MKHVAFLIIILANSALATKYFTREDFLQPDFDWNQLVVEKHFFRNNEECSFVREEVTVYQFTKLSKRGKPINGTVTISRGNEVDVRAFYDYRDPDEETGKNPIIPNNNMPYYNQIPTPQY